MVDVSPLGFATDTEAAEWLVREVGVAGVPGSSFLPGTRDAIRAVSLCQEGGDAARGRRKAGAGDAPKSPGGAMISLASGIRKLRICLLAGGFDRPGGAGDGGHRISP